MPASLLFPDATADALGALSWLRPDYADEHGQLWLAIQAFVVRAPTLTVVVDTCVGNDRQNRPLPSWNDLQTSFLTDLADAGVKRDRVGVVMCTHLHADHVGWNTYLDGGVWRPTFPNARYLVARAEFEHWSAQQQDLQVGAVFADSLVPIMEAGLLELVQPDHRICREIALAPTPGHTPGHVSVWVESRGERALITGDFIHHPCQMAHPAWREVADVDPEQSGRTRRAMLEACAGEPVLVIGTHFPSPAGGFVARASNAYRFGRGRVGAGAPARPANR